MWFFTHVWIIPALMALSFVLILFFGKRMPKKGAEIGNLVVQRTAEVSDSIFSTYLLPFEVISVLLLAALIGAIVLARRD